MVRRLGLARSPGDGLSQVVAKAGWVPIPLFLTIMEPTHAAAPLARPDALLVLSPGGVACAELPEGVPALVTGEGTARSLSNRQVFEAAEPRAESLLELLKERFSGGGDFLLVRGERSRGFIEEACADSRWRIHPWITHAERPLEPRPELPPLEAVLALSPLQGTLLGPLASHLLRFAWGERAAQAYEAAGFPASSVCQPKIEALGRMLRTH